jgi:predicted alpha/beta-fold hydrolase
MTFMRLTGTVHQTTCISNTYVAYVTSRAENTKSQNVGFFFIAYNAQQQQTLYLAQGNNMAATAWTIEHYCASQIPSDTSRLAESSQLFLQALNLPLVHPFCNELATSSDYKYQLDGVPAQGPLLLKDETYHDFVMVLFYKFVPPLLAMTELWIRLFAAILAPLGVAHLAHDNLGSAPAKNKRLLSIVCVSTLASSVVLVTDSLYILEWEGPTRGLMLLAVTTVLVARTAARHELKRVNVAMACILLLCLYLIRDTETGQLDSFGGAKADRVRIDEGLYYDTSSPLARNVVKAWPEASRTYQPPLATRWMPTGDARTGLPFLFNSVALPEWTRVWLPVKDDEVVALDIHFPPRGHDTSKPLYLLLHGLNGGSQEEYVKDFTWRRAKEGSTVAVMIARGLMDLPIRGMNLFHGARWTDAHEAACALKKAIRNNDKQMLAGVGYSMGGIILANYVSRSGKDCALDSAVVISGGLCMRYEIDFRRAQRLWQPILTQELRDKFVVGKWGERVRSRLTKDEMKEMLRAYHISEIDKTAIVAYNGFRDLIHYYSEMSALGDTSLKQHSLSSIDSGRIHDVTIPLLVLHAMDDPLVTWRTVAAKDGFMHPGNLTRTGTGNLFVLLTKRGGHVGWPLGWFPWVDNWKWMNDVAMSFTQAVASAKTIVE